MGLFGNDPTKAPGCIPTFLSELNPCQPWYTAQDKVTKRTLDIPASFAPTGLHTILFKLFLTFLAWGTLAYCFTKADHKAFLFAKFTYLTLGLQCIYHLISLSNSMCPTLRQPEEGGLVQGRAKSTWYFYNLSVHASILAGIMWWAMEFETSKLKLNNILSHGPVAVLLLLDGFWINRIPIRLFHWWSAVLPYELAYIGWTLAHAYLGIGNPDKPDDGDPDTNDDVIYNGINWKDDFVGTLVLVLIVLLVVGPTLQFILMLMSLYTWPFCCISDRRRYTTSAATFAEEKSLEEKSTEAQSKAEEGSIFASWG